MMFTPKNTKKKENSVYKSLYLKENLVKKVEEIVGKMPASQSVAEEENQESGHLRRGGGIPA